MLLGISRTLESAFGVPELSLGDTEAAELSKAYGDLAAHYPSLTLDPKYAAMANFGAVLAIIVGSRVTNFKLRRSMYQAPRQVPVAPPSNIYEAPPTAMTTHQTMQAQPGMQVNGVDTSNAAKKRPVPDDVRRAVLPGIGEIEFPADHPLVSGKPN